MAIQFLRGTTNAINASTQTLKPGQPLLNMDTGCLYLNSTSEGTVNGAHSFQYPSLKPPKYRTIELVLDSVGIEYGTSPNLGPTAVYYLDVDLGMTEIPKGTLFVNYSSDNSWFNESGFKYFDQITELHLRYALAVSGKTFYTYIHLYNIALPETTSAGWFEIDLPENLNPAIQKDQSIIGVFKGYRTTFPETTPPLVYDGSNIVVDSALYAYRDTANNFSAKQTFSRGIEVSTINDYCTLPTLKDYRVLATERPTNTTALLLPVTWTQQVPSSATHLRGQYTWSGSYSYSETDLPHELLTRKDSYLSLNSMFGNNISSSYDMLTRHLVFQDPTYGYRFPNITLDKVFVDKYDENISSSSNTTYYWGLSPAFWIAEDNESVSTPTIVSIAAHVSNEWDITWNKNLEEHRHIVTYYITAMGGPLA